MSFVLRAAQASSEDAAAAIPLIKEAYLEYANFICASYDETTVNQRLTGYFCSETPLLINYRNFKLLQSNAQTAAILCACPGSKIALFNNNLAAILEGLGDTEALKAAKLLRFEREAYDDEYYLDILTVSQNFRGQGLARLLADEALEEAKASGKERLTLFAKDSLIPFYGKLGFSFYEKRNIGGIEYNTMAIAIK